MSYDQDAVVGSRAVSFLLARINDSQRFRAVSVENSFLDTMHGIDCFILNLQALEMYTGSHRHVKNQYKDSDNVFLQIPFNDLEVQDLNSITN